MWRNFVHMKGYLLCLLFMSFCGPLLSQDLSGQWKGEFLDKSTSNGDWGGDRCEYVIDLDCKGSKVTGYSYTYFTDEGKRFYTICKLTGTFDKSKKYIEVREVERTKTNVPASIRNCFQLHKLTYSNADGSDNLNGNWLPAPDQDGNCGFGVTSLSRRALVKSFPSFNRNAGKSAQSSLVKNTAPKKLVTNPVVKAKTPVIAKATPVKPVEKENLLKQNTGNVNMENATTTKINLDNIVMAPQTFEKRNTSLLKTLEIDNPTVKIELYDNGEIDGDSISLYYNNKLLLGKKRLTDKAITLELPVESSSRTNELVMFAENLGTIPPNTALMVVTDGMKRYEVRITSDLQKSGTIRFVHKGDQ